MCQCNLKNNIAFCGRSPECILPFAGLGIVTDQDFDYEEAKWRVSMKGLTVVKGTGENRKAVYAFPDAIKGILGRETEYEQWLSNAEDVCLAVNNHIDFLRKCRGEHVHKTTLHPG